MKLSFNIKFSFLILLFIVAINLVTVNKAYAGTITISQDLDFGKFVLTDNNAPRSIEMLSVGGYIADPQYVFFTPPQRGIVTLTDFPPFTVLEINIGLTSLDQSGVTSNFSISNTFKDPTFVITDLAGEATFEVGAKLTSDGGGDTHTNGTYDGTFTITITAP